MTPFYYEKRNKRKKMTAAKKKGKKDKRIKKIIIIYRYSKAPTVTKYFVFSTKQRTSYLINRL